MGGRNIRGLSILQYQVIARLIEVGGWPPEDEWRWYRPPELMGPEFRRWRSSFRSLRKRRLLDATYGNVGGDRPLWEFKLNAAGIAMYEKAKERFE